MTPISFISQYFYKCKTEKAKAKALQGLGRQDWLKSYFSFHLRVLSVNISRAWQAVKVRAPQEGGNQLS